MNEFDEMNEDVVSDEYLSIDARKTKSLIWAVLSVVFSVLSLALCFINWVNFALATVGVLLSVVSRIRMGYFHNVAIAGLILGIVGAVFSLFYIFILASLFAALWGL